MAVALNHREKNLRLQEGAPMSGVSLEAMPLGEGMWYIYIYVYTMWGPQDS